MFKQKTEDKEIPLTAPVELRSEVSTPAYSLLGLYFSNLRKYLRNICVNKMKCRIVGFTHLLNSLYVQPEAPACPF